ncbi:MAG: 4Fe-4S binding protein [Clostridia bacterium]|nr:4Fe-4S binding protein [Clostridia bacterium]
MIADFFAGRCNAVTINLTNIDERRNFAVNGDCLFILPVYNGAIPAVCRQYIKNLDGEAKSAYIICVYGGVYRGKALQNAAGLLKNCGFTPLRGAYIAAPHTYCKKKLNLLDENRINSIYQKFFDFKNGEKMSISAKPVGRDKQAVLKKLTGKCVVNKNCNGCGQCINVCPVNAIDSDYKSNKNCILCGACVKICVCRARRIKFFTPLPAFFIKAKCKLREDNYFNFV